MRPNQSVHCYKTRISKKSLIFRISENGVINDTPREISHRNEGFKSTNFAIYRIELDKAKVQTAGAKFSYQINTGAQQPETIFTGFQASIMTNEQKQIISSRCSYIKFT